MKTKTTKTKNNHEKEATRPRSLSDGFRGMPERSACDYLEHWQPYKINKTNNQQNNKEMRTQKTEIKKRLEYLRQELRKERISYGELIELQSLAEYIEPGDVELLEAAGVPEY
jgi:DNA repair ATPase RecN